jgi:hypothetical protein
MKGNSTNYRVYASLFEHMNDGFVWLKRPDLHTRSVVKITCSLAKSAVFCEALQLEENFLTQYNSSGLRAKIETPETSIVMSSWYRKRLGNLKTHHEYPLQIDIADSLWGKSRACMQHPQNVVRVAMWLGIVSVGLGALGLLLGIASLFR